MTDRTITYTGQIPLANEQFLLPQRMGMASIAKLAEAVLGTGPAVDGLWVNPTAPASLAVRVEPGQIYMQAALDPIDYGSLPADTQHIVVKQGVRLDPLTMAITPPGTSGFAQWYLVQANFAEADAGNVILPYYNADNPAEALSGPNNSGNQQYTERRGTCVVQLKAGAPAPNGSHVRPQPDPGWVGLAWVNAIQGMGSVAAANIFPFPNVPRTRVKLPQIDRAIGFNYTVVSTDFQLTQEHAGIVVIDTSLLTSNITLRLPPAGSIPGIPLRLTIIARDFQPQVRRGTRPVATIVPSGTDLLETQPVIIITNDRVELASNGQNLWHWIGPKFARGAIAYTNTTQSIPSDVDTAVTFHAASDGAGWWSAAAPTQLRVPEGPSTRCRLSAGVVFAGNATGHRQARVTVNDVPQSAGLPSGNMLAPLTHPAYLTLAGGLIGPLGSDTFRLYVYQSSGAPLTLQAGSWFSVEVLH